MYSCPFSVYSYPPMCVVTYLLLGVYAFGQAIIGFGRRCVDALRALALLGSLFSGGDPTSSAAQVGAAVCGCSVAVLCVWLD